MKTVLIVVAFISAIILILSILATPAQTDAFGANINDNSSNGLFRKQKSKGFDAVLEKTVIISACTFMASCFAFLLL